MRISFHGAAHTVTGSQHLIEVNGLRLLLDCGLYQGRRSETYERNLNFKYDPRNLDAVILSHAHIDHAGNLPNLVKQGFEGNIFATRATVDLAGLMIMDSAHIQESDAEFVNKKRAQRGESPIEPLYTKADAADVIEMFQGVDYGEIFEPIPGVVARLYDAGHILGSAGVSLEIEEQGKKTRLWFSGDIGRYRMPLLRDPILPDAVDYMIMESTYGDKSHSNPENAFIEFRDVVKRTIERGGKVIVPAFSVGRTQELVYNLNEMMTEHEIPSVPVYVDSPLAVNATKVFRAHPECFDDETRQFVLEARHPALDFKMLTYVNSVDESKALNDRSDPMVIISASGMAETGRIVHHIRNNIENPKNTICIVSWQAPNTMGRRLADREPEVNIFGDVYQRNCDIATIGGLSGHAGQDLLLKYALGVKDTVKQIFLVHGEEKQAMTLKGLLNEKDLSQVHYPELHESVDL
ncbi:MBL fold metallo-hydrolase [Candidatus Villigracilis saccharophilus]|uniref:MBL fold metallo-hydrolase n=1 Tax=Candidatus Villigracilis saccharophilus TaxID=3140684 RepID=UPI0031374F5E|nr:MBL fold metallo-hydrolase [Anaerolineales bacterium]